MISPTPLDQVSLLGNLRRRNSTYWAFCQSLLGFLSTVSSKRFRRGAANESIFRGSGSTPMSELYVSRVHRWSILALPRTRDCLELRSVVPFCEPHFLSGHGRNAFWQARAALSTWADAVETVKRACLLVPSIAGWAVRGSQNHAVWRLRRQKRHTPGCQDPLRPTFIKNIPTFKQHASLRPQLPPVASPLSARQKSWCFEQTSSVPLALLCITRNFPLRIPCWGLGCPAAHHLSRLG